MSIETRRGSPRDRGFFCYFQPFRRGFWREFDFRSIDCNKGDYTRRRQKSRIITSAVRKGIQRETTSSRP